MDKLLKFDAVLILELLILLQILHTAFLFPQMDSTLISYDNSEEDSSASASNSNESSEEIDTIEKRNADVSTSVDKISKIVQSFGQLKNNITKRSVYKHYRESENDKNEMDNKVKSKRSVKRSSIIYSDTKNKFFDKRSILPIFSIKKRSISNNLISDEEIDVLDDFNFNSNDIMNPYTYVRFKRDIDSQEESGSENTGGIKDESHFVQPEVSSIPLLQMQMDNRTQVKVTVTNATDLPAGDHVQLNDILSNIKVKRDTNEVNEGSGKGDILNGVEDLELAESNIVFKPLFRYSSQISQRRRVFRNDYY